MKINHCNSCQTYTADTQRHRRLKYHTIQKNKQNTQHNPLCLHFYIRIREKQSCRNSYVSKLSSGKCTKKQAQKDISAFYACPKFCYPTVQGNLKLFPMPALNFLILPAVLLQGLPFPPHLPPLRQT